MNFYPALETYIQSILVERVTIPDERQRLLGDLAAYIRARSDEVINLTFICTHNSRRSHISQIWAATAAAYYGLDAVRSYSGGTEATAFNPRAVNAMERAGFDILNPGGENPRYQIRYSEEDSAIECFSKVYDDPFNPSADFAAIMTCSDADENCPFIPGAVRRFPLTYEDPKVADDTSEETARYDERVRQIGRELFYALSIV